MTTLLRRYAAFTLLLAAVLARGLVPQGYMPETDGQGGIEVRLCNGGSIVLPLQREDHAPSDKGSNDNPCAFAAIAQLDNPPPAPTLPSPATDDAEPSAPIAAVFARSSAVTLPPPATGPPLLV